MRKLTTIFAICFLAVYTNSSAQEKEIDSKKNDSSTEEYSKFRFGGYGEMVASWLDYGNNRMTTTGSAPDNRSTISIPRFVLALDYKFSPTWILGAEIEFEYGGVGTAKEIEYYTEGGEYETEIEKGGEVALEQFHITKLIHRNFNIRAGHMIVPVGLTNAHHEPINFFGTVRPEGETTILPSTWHENGIAVFGSFGRGFSYEAMVVAGLDPYGFRREDWITKGKQGQMEINTFKSPGYVGRLNYSGVKGLRVGVSGYYCKTGPNATKRSYYEGVDAKVAIISADAQYRSSNLIARANMIYGTLGNSDQVSKINKTYAKPAGFSGTPVGKTAVSYAGEVGYNIGSFLKSNNAPKIFPFVRYEYYSPMQETHEGILRDKRFLVSMWTVGANYYALPNLVVKADYTTRSIGHGEYRNENQFSIGLAYVAWFFKK